MCLLERSQGIDPEVFLLFRFLGGNIAGDIGEVQIWIDYFEIVIGFYYKRFLNILSEYLFLVLAPDFPPGPLVEVLKGEIGFCLL